MHDVSQAATPRSGRILPLALLAVALAVGMTACKVKTGDGKDEGGKDGKEQADKAPEAVPVEVAKAARRSIAASDMGTAPLEARGEAP